MRDMENYRRWRKENYEKNKEKIRKRRREYYRKNHEKCLEYGRKSWENNKSKYNAERNAEYNKPDSELRKKLSAYYKKLFESNPWLPSYRDAKSRCNNPNNTRFYCYGGRGIKFIMSKDDFKFLWMRDKASKMKRPTIDRIDNDGHYDLKNCRFIEMSQNVAKRNKENAKK